MRASRLVEQTLLRLHSTVIEVPSMEDRGTIHDFHDKSCMAAAVQVYLMLVAE